MLFVFFVATLNLAVGYALGAGLTLGSLLDRLPGMSRGGAMPIDDVADDDDLTRPADEPVAAEAEAVAAEPDPDPEPEPAVAAGPRDVLGELSSIREKLSSASVELKLSREDPKRFNECASKLQAANHGYVDRANAAADELQKLDAEGAIGADAARDVIVAGAEEAAKISDEFDQLMDGEITRERQQEIIDQATAMKESASRVQTEGESALDRAIREAQESKKNAAKTPDEPSAESPEPAGDSEPMDVEALFDRLTAALDEGGEEQIRFVGSLTPDPVEGLDLDADACDGLVREVDELLRMTLGPEQDYAAGARSVLGRPMIAFGADSFEEASNRMEQIRQSFEATEFHLRGEKFTATVTCALAEARRGAEREAIEGHLAQALEESERIGHNRTFHHDGAFPTALPTLPVEPIRRTAVLG